jgi:hypothetical protein
MHLQKAYLEPLLATGWLEMTILDKPWSRLKRYVPQPLARGRSKQKPESLPIPGDWARRSCPTPRFGL